jgi:hypothetical protein
VNAIEKFKKRVFKLERRLRAYPALKKLKYLYMKDRNPLHLWEAYSICRKWKMEIPEWVLIYLDDCAKNLLSIDRPARASEEAYKAIGFVTGSGTSPFTAREQSPLITSIGLRAEKLREQGMKSMEINEELAEEFPRAKKTIEKYRVAYEKIKNDTLPPL